MIKILSGRETPHLKILIGDREYFFQHRRVTLRAQILILEDIMNGHIDRRYYDFFSVLARGNQTITRDKIAELLQLCNTILASQDALA